MLSGRNELFVIGALIVYLAFLPRFQAVRDLLSSSVGKAAALAGIVYVHQKVSCAAALLLAIGYVRCQSSSFEGFTPPTATVAPTVTCPDGYAYDAVSKECKASSSMSGSVPAPPESTMGASVTTPPPNSAVSTAPMTTPTATFGGPSPPSSFGGPQPSGGSSSTVSPV